MLESWKKRSPIVRFLIVFVVLVALFYLVLWNSSWFHRYFVANVIKIDVAIASFILNIFGQATEANGSQILSEAFKVNVKTGCDGIEGMALFSAAVIAFPALLSKKIKGLALGVGVLFFVNLLRIIQLYLTGKYYPEMFDFLHESLWQIIFILLAVVLFAMWLSGIIQQKKEEMKISE